MKLQTEACNFIKKETLAQVFSCEFRKIFKSTYFTEHLQWLLLYFFSLSWKNYVLLLGRKIFSLSLSESGGGAP